MQNFFYKLRCAAARFMYGRNGVDQLCWALFIAELALSLLPALVSNQAFGVFIHYATLFLCVYLLFRMFSRDLEKRRAENARFLQWWSPKQAALRVRKPAARTRRINTSNAPAARSAVCRATLARLS